jgi:hypothetical protein
MLFKKSSDIFWDFWSKLFGNILKIFLISCSNLKLIFLESSAENIENAHLNFNQICPRFVSSLLFILLIIIFATKLQFERNPSKPFLSRIKINRKPQLVKLVSRPIHHVKFTKLNSRKKISFDVLKFRFFRLFSRI